MKEEKEIFHFMYDSWKFVKIGGQKSLGKLAKNSFFCDAVSGSVQVGSTSSENPTGTLPGNISCVTTQN